MNDILKVIKSLKESFLLIKGVSRTIKNETKEQKGGFLGMLLGTLETSLLGNLLTGKVTIRAGEGTITGGEGTIRAGESTIAAGEGTIRVDQDFQCHLILYKL